MQLREIANINLETLANGVPKHHWGNAMRGKYIIITTVLAFACGAGATSWRAANQISSRIQAATHSATMAQSNAEEKVKAAELAQATSEAAVRIAWDELALERKRREAAEQALDKANRTAQAKQVSRRKAQTELDNTKVLLLQQSATTRARKTRTASKHGGEARPEAYDACVVIFSTRHNMYERHCWRYRGSARNR